jgi:N-acetylglutamate synthase-like GNAT family acetyltransferase
MVRSANYNDIEQIVSLAVESVSNDPLPLTISRRKMRKQAEECIDQECVWVSEINGKVVGVVGGVIHDSFWFIEPQLTLLMMYCPVGGDGYRLLRKFAERAKAGDIGMAYVSLERHMDERYLKAFNRLGFTRPSPALIWTRS